MPRASSRPRASRELAQAFVDGLTDGECATALGKAGFGKVP